MNRKILSISLVVTGLLVFSIAYLQISGNGKQAKDLMVAETVLDGEASQSVTSAVMENDESSPGEYVDYREGIIQETSNTKLLFFHAPWCPQCRDLDADIKKHGVPPGVTIIKVDYDSNQQLRKKYNVTIQTTVVFVNNDGQEVSKYVAYDNPTLKAVEMGIFSR